MQPYSEEFIIRTNYVDIHRELHLYTLVNILQDLAARHADKLDFGWEFMNRNNWFWVLIRLRIDILRHPQWKEKINIQTWPKGYDALASYRDFIFTDIHGQEIIKATTSWIVLDRDSRRPVRMSMVFSQEHKLIEKHAIKEPAPKIKIPTEKNLLHSLKVLYTDLDMNLHMNNANYVRKILDAYPLDFLKSHHPKQLILNFLKETFHNDQLDIYLHNDMEDSVHYLSLVNGDGQASLFARILWEEKKYSLI